MTEAEAPVPGGWPPLRPLHGPRLTLEPLVQAHAAPMFVVLSDPAIYIHENAPPPSEAALRERYARWQRRAAPDGREAWLNWVLRLPDGSLAGYVQATLPLDGTAFVAYELASRHWGQGLAVEAVSAMLAELRSRYGVHTFRAVLKAANARSRALLHRLGFASAMPPPAALAGLVDADELLMSRPADTGTAG